MGRKSHRSNIAAFVVAVVAAVVSTAGPIVGGIRWVA
jgi:hypothetical protein